MIPDEERTESIAKADRALVKLENRAHNVFRFLVVALLIVVLGLGSATGYLIYRGNGEQARINKAVTVAAIDSQKKREALCSFFSVVSELTIPSISTKTAVEIVLDSRAAYSGLGCSPTLPPIPDSLKALAVKYNITIPKG